MIEYVTITAFKPYCTWECSEEKPELLCSDENGVIDVEGKIIEED